MNIPLTALQALFPMYCAIENKNQEGENEEYLSSKWEYMDALRLLERDYSSRERLC